MLKNRGKIEKSIILSSTRIVSLVIEATSPQLLRRRSENDLQSEWYAWLQVESGSIIKGYRIQIPFKLAANLWKASKNENSYDSVLIEGYRTRTKKSYGKLVKNMLVWAKRSHSFKYGTWGFLRCTQNDTDVFGIRFYKISKIVRVLWLAERRVCMSVCKHGCDVNMFCFSRANHASTNLKKVLSWKPRQIYFIYLFPRRLKLGISLDFSLEITF